MHGTIRCCCREMFRRLCFILWKKVAIVFFLMSARQVYVGGVCGGGHLGQMKRLYLYFL